MDWWIGLIAGAYVATVVIAFVVVTFFTILGGRERDLWWPFVAAPLWPIALLGYVLGWYFNRRKRG